MDVDHAADTQAMLALRQGQSTALEGLIRRHHAPLLGYLVRLLNGNRALAEDLAQETFLRVLRRAETFDPGRPFRSWAYAIATNLARDTFRRAESRWAADIEIDEAVPAPNSDPEDAALGRASAAQVMRALSRLSVGARSVVVLRFYNAMSLQEIALALDLPLGTVKSRLFSATRQLAALLTEDREEVHP